MDNNVNRQRLKTRLDKVVDDYQNLVEDLENLQWKIVRKQKEIQKICDKLGLKVKTELDNNENT